MDGFYFSTRPESLSRSVTSRSVMSLGSTFALHGLSSLTEVNIQQWFSMREELACKNEVSM